MTYVIEHNNHMKLQPLEQTQNSLFQRRLNSPDHDQQAFNSPPSSPSSAICAHCEEKFGPGEQMISASGRVWHKKCFVCAQCFRSFQDDMFFEFGGRRYCQYDFQILFAPHCNKCNEFITGRVIKAMGSSWHPDCFTCEMCGEGLADSGFTKYLNKALCKECLARERENLAGRYICFRCRGVINPGDQLHVKGEVYHAYHHTCCNCNSELTGDAKEKDGNFFCVRCFDKMGIPICGACRRPVEERVVHALGKAWHVEHFVCSVCERPFLGSRYFEQGNRAFCALHYSKLLGNMCAKCNLPVHGDAVEFTNKVYCLSHFTCSGCDGIMDQKSKLYDIDNKPICKTCLERLPHSFRKHLAGIHKTERKAMTK